MHLIPTALDGLVVVQSPCYADARGFFTEVYQEETFAALGLPTGWVQDNHSRSVRHVLRGLHFQRRRPQGKLVRPVYGAIFDVAVDLRCASGTFGRWFGTTLEAGDGRQLYVPPGFAHGFLVLSDHADVSYKCTAAYDRASEGVVAWNDPALGIEWPLPNGQTPLVSDKDAAAPPLAAVEPFR